MKISEYSETNFHFKCWQNLYCEFRIWVEHEESPDISSVNLAAVAHAALLWSWRVHRHLPCLRVRDWIRLGVDALFSIPTDKIGEMTIEF